MTLTIPDLSIEKNLQYWRHIESAKRYFLYLTKQLDIFPKPKKDEHDRLGLQFNFLMPYEDQPVMTGHVNGVITLNASEADIVIRVKTRLDMAENYLYWVISVMKVVTITLILCSTSSQNG